MTTKPQKLTAERLADIKNHTNYGHASLNISEQLLSHIAALDEDIDELLRKGLGLEAEKNELLLIKKERDALRAENERLRSMLSKANTWLIPHPLHVCVPACGCCELKLEISQLLGEGNK